MINFNTLEINLRELQKTLPKKPVDYTTDFPITIADALTKYANQRTVNLFGINVYNHNIHGWPVPLFVDNNDIKVGLLNNIFCRKQRVSNNRSFRNLQPKRKLKKLTFWSVEILPWNWVGVPIQRNILLKDPVDESVIEIFNANKKLIQNKLHFHPYLHGKEKILDEIFSSYKRRNLASRICTIFPLID